MQGQYAMHRHKSSLEYVLECYKDTTFERVQRIHLAEKLDSEDLVIASIPRRSCRKRQNQCHVVPIQ